MTTLSAWRPATAYAKGAAVRPNASQSFVPIPIANGDFESGDTEWDKDAGWAISTGSAYEGSYKAIFTGTGSGTIASSGTYVATAGQVIRATVKAKVLDADDGATALLLWYNSSDVLLETSTGLESSVESGVWMQLSVTGTGPANAAYVVFAVEATRTTGASVTIDDARWDYTAPIEARRTAYRAVQDAAGVSGVVEPDWPTTLGERVTDGTVIWEAVEVSWIEWTAYPIIESGLTEPEWPTTVGAFVRDGTSNWECVSRRVEDEKCPNTKVVAIASSKVFAADKDIVPFSATANPLDWSSEEDAGYLPTGLQQANANDMAVLFPYRGNLCAWNPNCFQMWQIDPDPTQMALLDQMDGIGSSHPLAARAVGNDLYFLAAQGVRSIGIANAAQNMQAGDVGMPIDLLVQAAMVQAAIDGKKAISTYWPGMGQYWLCFGDDGVTAGAGGALRLNCAPTGGTVGIAYSYTYTAEGGTAPYTYTVESGELPDGLTLDSETGELSGTPTTADTFSFGVKVTDALGVEAFCGWQATVVEDEVVIEAGEILITGSGAGGTPTPFITAIATEVPSYVGIPTSTGADLDGAACSVSENGMWIAVTEDELLYSTDINTLWTSVSTGYPTETGRFAVYGADGWLIQYVGATHAGAIASASATPTDAAALTITISGYGTRGTLSWINYVNSEYVACVGFGGDYVLVKSASLSGTWTPVTTETSSISTGTDSVRFFYDTVIHEGAYYAACYTASTFGGLGGGDCLRKSTDGMATWDTNVVDGRADAAIDPFQMKEYRGTLLVVSRDATKAWTSADNFAVAHATGVSRATADLPRNETEGRFVAAAGGRFYIMGDTGSVSTVNGTSFSAVASYPPGFSGPISIAARDP